MKKGQFCLICGKLNWLQKRKIIFKKISYHRRDICEFCYVKVKRENSRLSLYDDKPLFI